MGFCQSSYFISDRLLSARWLPHYTYCSCSSYFFFLAPSQALHQGDSFLPFVLYVFTKCILCMYIVMLFFFFSFFSECIQKLWRLQLSQCVCFYVCLCVCVYDKWCSWCVCCNKCEGGGGSPAGSGAGLGRHHSPGQSDNEAQCTERQIRRQT